MVSDPILPSRCAQGPRACQALTNQGYFSRDYASMAALGLMSAGQTRCTASLLLTTTEFRATCILYLQALFLSLLSLFFSTDRRLITKVRLIN
jgi:hypothetical protein